MKKFLFSAGLEYTFRQHQIATCANCQKPRDQHSEDDCLFEASRFQKQELTEFFERMLHEGATLTMTCGPYTLTQKMSPSVVDDIRTELGRTTVNLKTVGDAHLEVNHAEER